MDFMAMSTSATILTTATVDRCQNAGSRPSAVFVQTRRTMSVATRVLLHTTAAANTAPDLRVVDTPVAVKRVAQRCGFGSEETMRRSFLRLVSTSPQDYRARFS